METIDIRWKSDGYTDVIPLDWFSVEYAQKRLEHAVTGPKGGKHAAMCVVDVKSRYAELDYNHSDVRKFNEPNWIFGTLRITFADARRHSVQQLQWKYPGKSFKNEPANSYEVSINHNGNMEGDIELEGFEGEAKQRFVTHRKREARMRRAKVQKALAENHGRLICEVKNCGFDFCERYGEIGMGYAVARELFATP
jgi:hypothetical protein